MEDGERIARVEVGMESHIGQFDRMASDLAWLREELGRTNERLDRGLAENRREINANTRWLMTLSASIILAVIGMLLNAILRT